jgi:hypothetical protein
MKKIISYIICTLLCLKVWGYTYEVDGITYNNSKKYAGCVEVSGLKQNLVILENLMLDYTSMPPQYIDVVNIPETITVNGHTYEVVGISYAAFEGYGRIKSISIPQTVKYFEDFAFKDCGSLAEINIPNTITKIGWRMFEGCTSLKHIDIPSSVIQIGGSAFEGCGLESITIPETVKKIGPEAFAGCNELITAKIFAPIQSLPEGCFDGCDNLENVIIPATVTSIEEKCFYYCPRLSHFDFLTQIEKIGDFSFCGSGMEYVNIGTSTSYIGNNAFSNCKELKSITINSPKLDFGDMAFEGCMNLRAITIDTWYIPERAFSGCESLSEMHLSETVRGILSEAFVGCDFSTISIPSTIEYIGKYAFKNCTSLTSLELPDTNLEICSDAFRGCNNLIKVEVPKSITFSPDSFDVTTKVKKINARK